MSDTVSIGTITITYDATPDGDLITGVTATGDMPLVTKLGLLDLARDTMLNGHDDE